MRTGQQSRDPFRKITHRHAYEEGENQREKCDQLRVRNPFADRRRTHQCTGEVNTDRTSVLSDPKRKVRAWIHTHPAWVVSARGRDIVVES
jgi:hypothetical protein